jgi:hypothetical protein
MSRHHSNPLAPPGLAERLARRLADRDHAQRARREHRDANPTPPDTRAADIESAMPTLSGWGARGRAAGRRRPLRLPPLVATTAQLCSAYPWMTDPGFGVGGPVIGIELISGSPFLFSAHELYRAGVISAPNITLTGALGSAKSALCKCMMLRLEPFGIPAHVVDRKAEYGPISDLIGMTHIRVGAGLGVRLNPFQTPKRRTSHAGPEFAANQRSQRLLLLEGLLEVHLSRPLEPAERSLLAFALDAVTGEPATTGPGRAGEPAFGPLAAAAADPSRWRHRLDGLRYPVEDFQHDTRTVRLALAEFVTGALSGLFAREPAEAHHLSLGERGTCVDISSLRQSDTAAIIALSCAHATLEAELASPDYPPSLCVYDELALLAASPALTSRLRQRLKLTRATGAVNLLAFHRFSELDALGGAGSEHSRAARGLIEDSGVRISYWQPEGSQRQAQEWMGLSETATQLLGRLRTGVGLWAIGDRIAVVQHHLSSVEVEAVQTHSRMQHPDLPDPDDHEYRRRVALVRGIGEDQP